MQDADRATPAGSSAQSKSDAIEDRKKAALCAAFFVLALTTALLSHSLHTACTKRANNRAIDFAPETPCALSSPQQNLHPAPPLC